MKSIKLKYLLASLSGLSLIGSTSAFADDAVQTVSMGMDRTRLNIGVYCLGPAAQTENHIRDLKDCGVDFVTSIAGGADMRKTFDLFQKYGIGAIVPLMSPYWNEASHVKNVDIAKAFPLDKWIWNAEKHALRSHPAIWGYDLGDEPDASTFPFFGEIVRTIRERCPEKILYLNLYPNCVPKTEHGEKENEPNWFLGTCTYEEYIDRFCRQIPLDYVCYDFYLYRQHKRRIPLSYENMRVVSDACRKNGRDFWTVLQVNSDVPDRYTSLNGLRFQAYQAMAYGVSTILWACYSPCWWHHNVLTDAGEKTEQYEKLKQVNAEIHAFGKYYMLFRNEATTLVGDFRNPNTFFLPESDKILQRGEKAGQSPVLKAFANAAVSGLHASGEEALIVGDMVGRANSKTRALFICAADDPMGLHPKRYDIVFGLARGWQVRAFGIDGQRAITRVSGGTSQSHPSYCLSSMLVRKRDNVRVVHRPAYL